jgi:hypothetical protein
MKRYTYHFIVRTPDNAFIPCSVEAEGKTIAYHVACADTRFKNHKVLKATFRREDTAKGANRAGGLDSNGKQLNARNLHHPISTTEMSNEKKLDLLDQVRDLLAFPDMDDNEWILEEAMKLLQITKGVNSTLE